MMAAGSLARRAGFRGGWLVATAGLFGWYVFRAGRLPGWIAILWRIVQFRPGPSNDVSTPDDRNQDE